MDTSIVVSQVGEVQSVTIKHSSLPPISDARLFQSPSLPMEETLSSPVFNWTLPVLSAQRLNQKKVRLGFIAKELALFEVFLGNNSHNSWDMQVFWLFKVCLSMEEALLQITITSAKLFTELVWFRILFSNTEIAVK